MILFGESLNVISNVIGKEFKEPDPAKRNPEPIQKEVIMQKEKGMDYIDINLGPAKKVRYGAYALGGAGGSGSRSRHAPAAGQLQHRRH